MAKLRHVDASNATAALLMLGLGLAASLTAGVAAPVIGANGSAWEDPFDSLQIERSRWVIANGRAPGYIPDRHIGYYQPDHVTLGGGFLTMRLTQEVGQVDTYPAGIISRGALIYTKKKYGYGTYEWRMRMSSTAPGPFDPGDSVSGSVSAGFIYQNNSQTEIDFEFSGRDLDTLYLVNWYNSDPTTGPFDYQETFTPVYPIDVTGVMRTYRFVWEPGQITYYVDGQWQATHTTNVPSAPAHFMINHWGTDSPNWGGVATVGTTRYFHIDWVKFTPL